jgi:hypothetical protein
MHHVIITICAMIAVGIGIIIGMAISWSIHIPEKPFDK